MESRARARLASVAVLFLVFVTGFLLGMAWDRTDGSLKAGEADEEQAAVARADEGPAATGSGGEVASRDDPDAGTPDREDDVSDRDDGDRNDGDDDRDGRDEDRDGRDEDRDARDDDRHDGDRDRDDRRLIVHEVGITGAQEARVDSIVDLHRDRIRDLRREMESEYDPRFRQLRREMESEYDPRFQDVLLETRGSIRSLLTPEQAVRYDSLLAEHDRKEAERKRDRRR